MVAIPPSICVMLATSVKVSPPISTGRGSISAKRPQPFERLLDRVLRRPRPGRVAADAVEGDPRVQVAEAAGLDRVVGRLEQDRQPGIVHEPGRVEERRQRAVLGGQLLLAEGRAAPRRPPARRPRVGPEPAPARASPRAPPFMSLAPSPATAPFSIAAREVVLRGHGVVDGPASTTSGRPSRRGRARTKASSASYSGANDAGRANGRAPRSPPRSGSRTGCSRARACGRPAGRRERTSATSVAQSPT